ncbi:MAG TPA: CAP domain-containing protein [Solirubrobacter sp.]|jgi:uncharacterized protein YkwD|nr:CAP domain-containing protein [Solirubrobacter sp.]
MITTARFARPLCSAAATSLILLGLLAPNAAAAECPGANDIPATQDDTGAAASAVMCLVNAERTKRDLKPLKRDKDLAQAARGHSADMVRRNFFSHVTPGGTDLKDRLREAGYGKPSDGWRAGENIGWGTGSRATPASLVDEWLDSPAHKRNMLQDHFREIGVGVAAGAPKASTGGLPGATYTIDLGVIRPG